MVLDVIRLSAVVVCGAMLVVAPGARAGGA